MAIYHLTTKPLGRAGGRSAVAAAAYRSGVSLRDERTGTTHDYSRRSGVEAAVLITPDGRALDAERAALWNAAESAERRKDARTAREWVVALPAELSAEDREALAVELAQELASRYGVGVDLAVHAPGKRGDDRNHHAHLLATTRQVTRDQAGHLVLGDKAAIELSDTKRKDLGLGRGADEVKAVRQVWENLANRALARAGHEQRIDHRTLKEQGVDRLPTIHLGPAAAAMERRREATERGDVNREVAQVLDLAQEKARLLAERDRQLEEARRLRQFEAEQQRQVAAASSRSPATTSPATPAKTSAEFVSSHGEDSNPAVRLAQGKMLEERWTALVGRELAAVRERAAKLEVRIRAALKHASAILAKHQEGEPEEPGTVAKAFGGRDRWQAAHRAWAKVRKAIENRIEQLTRRRELVHEYAKEPLPGYPTAGTRLAERKVAKREPQLAAGVGSFRDWQREDASKKLRAELELRRSGDRGHGRGGPDR